jgi:hypothetical protein
LPCNNIIRALRVCRTRVVCICVFSTAPLSRQRNHADGDGLLFTPSAAANASGNVLGRVDFLRNLKDPIHDSAMSVNATTSIDSPCRRLVGSSTRRSRSPRFHTQAHHRQPLARYAFIHFEEFDQYSTYPSHSFKLIRHVARWGIWS